MMRKNNWLMVVLAVSLAACSPQVAEHGHVGLDRSLAKVREGVSTTADVESYLGTPSSRASFGENIWYYIRTASETKAFLRPEVVRQHVVAIHFDPQNRVQHIEQYDMEDGRRIAFSEEKTPTEGNEMNAVQQLIGNLGRFNSGPQDTGGQ